MTDDERWPGMDGSDDGQGDWAGTSGRPEEGVVGHDAEDATTAPEAAALVRFWEVARAAAGIGRLAPVVGVGVPGVLVPPAGRLGRDAGEADRAVADVLAGRLRATTTALAELEAAGSPVPAEGDLWILTDGEDRPRALLRTTRVRVLPLDEVPEDHARAEGHADLGSWRAAAAQELTAGPAGVGSDGAGSDDARPTVVLEEFESLHPRVR